MKPIEITLEGRGVRRGSPLSHFPIGTSYTESYMQLRVSLDLYNSGIFAIFFVFTASGKASRPPLYKIYS